MKQVLFFLIGLILGAGTIYYMYGGTKNLKTEETTIKLDKDTKGFANIVTDSADRQHIANFERNPLNDTSRFKYITYSVYFDKQVFQYIGNYFDTTKRNVEGIRIYNTEYDHILRDAHGVERSVIGQQAINQRSILFVPTTLDKKPDWSAWDINTFPGLKRDGYNHGELCPNSCP
jgi:hypothetical protein